jgi:hypothetical protein
MPLSTTHAAAMPLSTTHAAAMPLSTTHAAAHAAAMPIPGEGCGSEDDHGRGRDHNGH